MARGDYTLAINSGLLQDITALTISNFPRSSRPQKPSSAGAAAGTQHTPAQVPLYTGQKRRRYIWSVVCVLSEADMLKLGGLFEWQQNRLLNQLDGRLTWTDEILYAAPQATPTRTFVSNLTSADGQTYGFPIVDCEITDPEISIYGGTGANIDYLCSFVVTEVRSA